jgi:hypothetical protein
MPEKRDGVDVRENDLLELSPEVLDKLLRDHTTGKKIFWATHDYEALGSGYDYHAEILPPLITGENSRVIRPRVLKSKENQTDRSKDMAEVFTPSWICDAQNNLVDEAIGTISSPSGELEGGWQDYVRLTCLEITCGEAPYLVSRYDAATGESIPLEKRVGLLDRKLRLVNAHTATKEEWTKWALIAYHHTYGYEWQGDSLLLARQALLYTFIEYYEAKFGEQPEEADVLGIADVISWNLWQMDGLKGVVPDSCHSRTEVSGGLFDGPTERIIPCTGCDKDDLYHHNGTYCRIFDWDENKEVRFVDLLL